MLEAARRPIGAHHERNQAMKPKNHMVLTTFMLPAGYHKDSWRME